MTSCTVWYIFSVFSSFKSMLALAKLYLTVDDLDACQQQCVALLKMDPGNDSATVVCIIR